MKEEILTFPKDYCLVEIDEKQNLEHKFEGADGETVTLTLDIINNRIQDDFIPEDNYIPHEGKVLSVPRTLSKKAERWGLKLGEIKPGDTVYLNHLAVNSDRKLSESKYFISIPRDLVGSITSNFLAKKEGDEIIPIFDWNMFKPVVNEYENSTIIIPDHVKKKREDILELIHPSSFSKSEGAKKGDRFVVNPDTIYPIKIEDEDYFMVRNENLLLKILD